MKLRTLVELLALSAAVSCAAATPGFADAGRCRHVGGGILTNFLDPNTCGGPTGLCSDGTATGDLNGAIGVSVLAVTGNVYHVHHHAVTATGDTIFWQDADLTTFPTGDTGRVLADYLKGVTISGGTGGFTNAHGFLNSVFGAIDLDKGELTLRYEGYVCFAPVQPE
ncbi:MAG TPA: hypothetical protein VKF83_10270 [Stellaceae bacterium]|nr:hypothetical protein [Stellaceae bacterium]